MKEKFWIFIESLKEWPITLLYLMGIFSIVGAIFFTIDFVKYNEKTKNYVLVTGVCIDKTYYRTYEDPEDGSTTDYYKCTIEYELNGDKYTYVRESSSIDLNEEVEFKMDPEHPSEVEPKNKYGDVFGFILFRNYGHNTYYYSYT